VPQSAAASGKVEPLTIVKKSVREANQAVLAEASARGSNMGTTLGVAVLKDGKAYIANVGDSRAYWIENGTIRQITEDHSLVAKLVSWKAHERRGADTRNRTCCTAPSAPRAT
jgi:protein phosphatase